mgnify:FL=1
MITIQQTVEEAIAASGLGQVSLIGCGRTDAGAHALNYLANFYTDRALPVPQIKNAINAHLPQSIRVLKVSRVPPSFHSRYLTVSKIYRYLIADRYSPFLESTAWVITRPLDISKMKAAAAFLTGKHDFASFQSAGSKIKSTVREIRRIQLRRSRFTLDPAVKILTIEIESTGFLYKMARNIVGLLVRVGQDKLPVAEVPGILSARDRRQAPPPAPAAGLYLKKVKYERMRPGSSYLQRRPDP